MINIQEAVAQSFDRVGQRRFVDGWRVEPAEDVRRLIVSRS